jgi:hypothetical protein
VLRSLIWLLDLLGGRPSRLCSAQPGKAAKFLKLLVLVEHLPINVGQPRPGTDFNERCP